MMTMADYSGAYEPSDSAKLSAIYEQQRENIELLAKKARGFIPLGEYWECQGCYSLVNDIDNHEKFCPHPVKLQVIEKYVPR